MTAPHARLVEFSGDRPGKQVFTWCPGCDMLHPFTIEAPAPPDGGEALNRGVTWTWDGDLERPTFEPSLLVHTSVHLCANEHGPVPCPNPETCDHLGHQLAHDGTRLTGTPHTRDPAWGPCHSFLRAGRWEFLSDSAHHLAGQTVDMVPLPSSHYREES